MYIIKNALRNISRSKGRTILIGLIALLIGLSSCLALSIKQAAISEKENGLANLNVTASISYDRQGMMEKARTENEDSGSTADSDMKDAMKQMSSLSLNEMQTYAKAASVKDFYYTLTSSLNGNSIDPIDTSTNSDNEANDVPQDTRKKEVENQGDFTIVGYSSYDAMSDFIAKTKAISTGVLFDEQSSKLTCIINQELATLNSIKVGGYITLENPQNEKETYKIKVVGIYTTSETSEQAGGFMNMKMSDPANQIYMSYTALNTIVEASKKVSEDTNITGQVSGTYAFDSVEDYEKFEDEAKALGLSDEYVVSSSDINAYEQSLAPLVNLSTYATTFLYVILAIGGCVLVVLNIYHIRERKYEIGVLAAIGMNKAKVASQFISEIFIVTMLSIVIGAGIGATLSVPLTNSLLSSQTTQSTQNEQAPGMDKGRGSQGNERFTNVETIKEVSNAITITVILQLAGIAILLTVIAGGISVLTVLRYEPIRILSERE